MGIHTAPIMLTDDELDEYLVRVGRPAGPATTETLHGLTEAHVLAIPFENVDVVLGRHRGIGLDAVVDKLVRRRRGGYCYEHNGLMAAVLERLGFPVRRIVTRVQPHLGGPNCHLALIVTADGEDHLVDVGFGASRPAPIPLRDGAEADQFGWRHRLERDGRYWTVMEPSDEGESPGYRFTTDPGEPADYEMFHHYTSTYPGSPFVGQLVVMRAEPGRQRRLVRRDLTDEYVDGTVENRPVDDPVAALADLDVHLDAEESAALEQWWSTPA